MINYFSKPIFEDQGLDIDLGSGIINEKYLESVILSHQEKDPFHSKEALRKNYSKLFNSFSAIKFLHFDKYYYNWDEETNLLAINVPLNFNWKKTNYIFNGRGLECINLPINNQPKAIKDLKRYIISRTITSREDLINKIIKFNNFSYHKLMNIYTNNKFNSSIIVNESPLVNFKEK